MGERYIPCIGRIMYKSILDRVSENEIIERYIKLTPGFSVRLGDYVNDLFSLSLLSDDKDYKREMGQESVNREIDNGKEPFPRFYGRVREKIAESVNRKDGKYTQLDQFHLEELDELTDFANKEARKGMSENTAKIIHNILFLMLYGKKDNLTNGYV